MAHFYFRLVSDKWLASLKLRACSYAAKGLWIDMLCLMDKSTPRGCLRWEGPDEAAGLLSRLLGGSPAEIRPILDELLNAQVASLSEDRRYLQSDELMRQAQKSDACKHAGHKGGRPPKKGDKKGVPKGHQKGDCNYNCNSNSDPPTASHGKQGNSAREPDPLWDAVADEFYGGKVPKSCASRVGMYVRDLRELGAKPEEISVKAAQMRDKWGNRGTVTLKSMVEHWHEFSGDLGPEDEGGFDKPRPITDDVARALGWPDNWRTLGRKGDAA